MWEGITKRRPRVVRPGLRWYRSFRGHWTPTEEEDGVRYGVMPTGERGRYDRKRTKK